MSQVHVISTDSTYLVIEVSNPPGWCSEQSWIGSEVGTGQVTQFIQPHYYTTQLPISHVHT